MGALVTIKQCSAILVRTIFLIVTYPGDLVALPDCLLGPPKVHEVRAS